ncbi:peritrophin-1-like [Argiope bruennichi]|uniref:Peritrophin-1 like protein n=1 Tax=Argiope bruennichi TaxID=94029 RepID=A0A8T0FKN2_ARGBR|nr:peritrophin-1-like [Argiope bruennichi]XP_055939617.1 peritrophin-1-like [Argiope bruennichi]KAF8791777.1 Peritrophin-1 like protein [Argiope bruennichi]
MAKIMVFLSFLLGTVLVTVDTFPSADSQSDFTWAPRCPTSSSGKIPRLIPDPTNCRSAFICSDKGPLRYFCPRGLVFHATEQECVLHKSCIKESDEYTAFMSCPEKNGRDIVSFAHPTDCQMYYLCDHGIAYPRRCPSDLHYNPELRVCDFSWRANCKARFLSLQP